VQGKKDAEKEHAGADNHQRRGKDAPLANWEFPDHSQIKDWEHQKAEDFPGMALPGSATSRNGIGGNGYDGERKK
jgi:hypothetical protein